MKGKRFWIYVIEVDACSIDKGEPCLYVGTTAHSIRERYRQHKERGETASHMTRRWGASRLRPDLAKGRYGKTREEAEALEAKVIEELRKQGFVVNKS